MVSYRIIGWFYIELSDSSGRSIECRRGDGARITVDKRNKQVDVGRCLLLHVIAATCRESTDVSLDV